MKKINKFVIHSAKNDSTEIKMQICVDQSNMFYEEKGRKTFNESINEQYTHLFSVMHRFFRFCSKLNFNDKLCQLQNF